LAATGANPGKFSVPPVARQILAAAGGTIRKTRSRLAEAPQHSTGTSRVPLAHRRWVRSASIPFRRTGLQRKAGWGADLGTAASLCGVRPPESAGVLGAARPRPARPGVALAAAKKPGRRGRALPTAAVTPETRRHEERRSPWPWKLFSLDFESLMSVRGCFPLPLHAHNHPPPHHFAQVDFGLRWLPMRVAISTSWVPCQT